MAESHTDRWVRTEATIVVTFKGFVYCNAMPQLKKSGQQQPVRVGAGSSVGPGADARQVILSLA